MPTIRTVKFTVHSLQIPSKCRSLSLSLSTIALRTVWPAFRFPPLLWVNSMEQFKIRKTHSLSSNGSCWLFSKLNAFLLLAFNSKITIDSQWLREHKHHPLLRTAWTTHCVIPKPSLVSQFSLHHSFKTGLSLQGEIERVQISKSVYIKKKELLLAANERSRWSMGINSAWISVRSERSL